MPKNLHSTLLLFLSLLCFFFIYAKAWGLQACSHAFVILPSAFAQSSITNDNFATLAVTFICVHFSSVSHILPSTWYCNTFFSGSSPPNVVQRLILHALLLMWRAFACIFCLFCCCFPAVCCGVLLHFTRSNFVHCSRSIVVGSKVIALTHGSSGPLHC